MMRFKSNTNFRMFVKFGVFGAVLFPLLTFGQSQEKQQTLPSEGASEPGVSTFTIPGSLKEGRDPFYPNRTGFLIRQVEPVPDNTHVPVVLEFKGLSGTDERPLAIINNRTFAVGEEQEITTSQGRVKLRLLEIDSKAMRVKVLAQGETRELLFGKSI